MLVERNKQVFKSFGSLFPIEAGRITIGLVEKGDIDWYIETVYRPFFSEYLDYKAEESQEGRLREHLRKLVIEYKVRIIREEIRLVIKFNGENIGGITLQKDEKETEEKGRGVYWIGYWVVPERQGHELGYKALRVLTKNLNELWDKPILRAEIQEVNIKSIKLINKLGFKQIGVKKGKCMKNVIYELN